MTEQTSPKREYDTPASRFALVAATFEGCLVPLAMILGWLVGQRPLDTLTWSSVAFGWGIVAALPPLGGMWLCTKSHWRPLVRLMRVFDRQLAPMFRRCRIGELAVISLLAGLGEEILFRGLFQQTFAAWVGGTPGVWVGLGVASLLFGLAHRITFTYAIFATSISLYLGGLWLLTNNLVAPIIAHAVYDFVALVYLLRWRKPPP